MSVRCIHGMVCGRVQGVYFRDSTQREANRLQITGWVRNNDDGTVELMAKGESESIETFIEWLGHGPTAARVDELTIIDKSPDDNHFSAFDVTA